MEKQAFRGKEDLPGPPSTNLADIFQAPGLDQRTPKNSKVRARDSSGSESSQEKPLRKNPKMSTVKEQIAALEPNAAILADNDESGAQTTSGNTNPPGRRPANTGKNKVNNTVGNSLK